MSQSHPQAPLASISRPYADWLESEFGSTHSWLIEFLQHGCRERPGSEPEIAMCISILDSVNGVLSAQDFLVNRETEVDSAFRETLRTRPAGSKTRLVLVQTSTALNANVSYIDAIGWQYRLDPLFLCMYFQRRLSLEGRYGRITGLPTPLPSEDQFITINTSTRKYMFATILLDNGQATGETVLQLHIDHGCD